MQMFLKQHPPTTSHISRLLSVLELTRVQSLCMSSERAPLKREIARLIVAPLALALALAAMKGQIQLRSSWLSEDSGRSSWHTFCNHLDIVVHFSVCDQSVNVKQSKRSTRKPQDLWANTFTFECWRSCKAKWKRLNPPVRGSGWVPISSMHW